MATGFLAANLPPTTFGGIVLCGGQSKRMGRDKAWLPFAGELMLPRIVRLLSEAFTPIVVVAARDQLLPPLPLSVQIVHDDEQGRGPLQGLAAGLTALRGQVDAAYVSSCDVPFLRPAFVKRMTERLSDRLICVPRVGGFLHPLAAVYRVEVVDTIHHLLAQNLLRTSSLVDLVPTQIVEAPDLADVDPAFSTLRNVNTPEDYEQALQEI